jgi:hypothetical protein
MKTNPSISGGRVHAGGHRPERPWQLRVGFWLLLAIAAFYLFTEHRIHLALGLPYLPFLLLVACPLIHLFGHSGHGGHAQDSPNDVEPSLPSDAGPDANERKADVPHRHGGRMP